tara:strand:- start:249 stop:890 length:642 start_codon:yes stop_codon:yes gene_type:complete
VQALEKVAIHTIWIPMVLVLLLAIIAVLKIIDVEKLKGYALAIFNKGFLEDEVEEDTSFFSSFYSLLLLFSSIVLALVISLFVSEIRQHSFVTFSSFLYILGVVFGYFVIKSLLEVLLTKIFLIEKQVRYYLISKFGYLYSISFFLLVFFILFQFGPLNFSSLIRIISVLFFISFILHLVNNKKLIFSELFYFILYLCAFEIGPLLILFKMIL